MEMEFFDDPENEQGKTYIGQVQADCFCEVNVLDGQTNPTILIKISSSYLLICFAWPLQTHSIASQVHTLNYTLKLTARTKRCDKRDDFDFPVWIFHLYVATFQHHMHMEYAIPDFWFLSGFPW